MNYDIPESVSQGSNGAYDEENRRIHEIADELCRRCQLYEAQLRDGKESLNTPKLTIILEDDVEMLQRILSSTEGQSYEDFQ